MLRSTSLALACWIWITATSRADDYKQLQDTVQKAIEKADPAIACILVSRSDAYQRFGQGPSVENPGQLGKYLPGSLNFPSKMTRDEQEVVRKKLDLADPENIPESFGSGIAIDGKGLILTNYHVVQGAVKIYVRLPGGRGSYADIHAADPRSDLAVLRLLAPPKDLSVIPIGDGGKVKRGEMILTMANPFAAGFRDSKPSASFGIISNIRQRVPTLEPDKERHKTLHHYGTLIQTDARLNLGCSGGALINLKGEMIGLTTALVALHGAETAGSFAVPLDAAMKRIIDVLKRGEEVEYGFLGVQPDRPPDQKPRDGVLLVSVVPGSPAKRDGRLNPKDTLLAVNGTPIRDDADLFLAVGVELAGTRVTIDVRRAGTGEREKVEVTLGKFLVFGKPIVSSLGNRPFVRGLRVDDTCVLAQQSGRAEITAGVLVTDVQSNSAAAKAKFRQGEIITHVNGTPVFTPAAFYREMQGRGGAVELTLYGVNGDAPKVTIE
jgi:serine protease Do